MKQFIIPLKKSDTISILIKVNAPNYQQNKEFVLSQDEEVIIGSNSSSNLEIFDKTVAPNHVTLKLIENAILIKSEHEQTHYDLKNKKIFIGLVCLEITQLFESNNDYQPINTKLFKIMTKPNSKLVNFMFFSLACIVFYCLWITDNVFLSIETNEMTLSKYFGTFVAPNCLLAISYLGYFFLDYYFSDKAPKNKPLMIRNNILKIFSISLFIYSIFILCLYFFGLQFSFIRENYYLIKTFSISIVFIILLSQLHFLYNYSKKQRFKQILYSFIPLLFLLMMFSDQINQKIYLLDEPLTKIDNSDLLEKKAIETIQLISSNYNEESEDIE